MAPKALNSLDAKLKSAPAFPNAIRIAHDERVEGINDRTASTVAPPPELARPGAEIFLPAKL
jgi:hypothetical protein